MIHSRKNVLFALLAVMIITIIPVHADAQSDYEFYFFGINLKSFQGSNWLKVTAGAVASVLVHELGHALYLQSQGKDWDLQSSSSGLATHTRSLVGQPVSKFRQGRFCTSSTHRHRTDNL